MDGFQATVGAIWRVEAPRLVARLTRLVGDLGVAEDIPQDTFVAAMGRWPATGIPDNPGAGCGRRPGTAPPISSAAETASAPSTRPWA